MLTKAAWESRRGREGRGGDEARPGRLEMPNFQAVDVFVYSVYTLEWSLIYNNLSLKQRIRMVLRIG